MQVPSQTRMAVLAAFTLIACGDDSGSPDSATEDSALRDEGSEPDDVDIPDDDVPDAGMQWRHRPVFNRARDVTCDDWEAVADPLPRELPADPTPRVLWHYQPLADPGHPGGSQSFVSYPTVSPDGTIWVHGPFPNGVSQLTREGTLRRFYEVAGVQFPDSDPENPERLGPIAAAPDGTLIALAYSESPDAFGRILRLSDAGEDSSSGVIGRSEDLPLGPDVKVAVGPGGMVYVVDRDQAWGYCRGVERVWSVQNLRTTDDAESGYFSHVFVEANGDVLLTGAMQRVYRVTEDGLEAFQPPADHEPELGRTLFAMGSDLRFVAIGVRGDVAVERNTNFRIRRVSGLSAVSPSGVVYSYPDGIPSMWDSASDEERPLATESAPFGDSVWLDNGDYIQAGGVFDEVVGLHRLLSDATHSWAVDLQPLGIGVGGPLDRIMDSAGVYYQVIGGVSLAAVQTDGLPFVDGCVWDPCNATRDRWTHPE